MADEKFFCMATGKEELRSECREIWIRGDLLPKFPAEFKDEYFWTPNWKDYPEWMIRENVEAARLIQITKLNSV